MQDLIFTNEVAEAVGRVIAELAPDRVFVVADENTFGLLPERWGEVIVIAAGDESKTLEGVGTVWRALVEGGATRRSVVVNFGGGMVTDLGGFAASTFKRGVRFVNVPTTLLGAVDAAVGGKTGVNFMGLKNEIGAFREASAVVISSVFFGSLPQRELLSGYAEMVKHALIADAADYAKLLGTDPLSCGSDEMLSLLRRSVEVKRRIVAEDPLEKGLRKTLNLGHTAGHAFEEMMMERGCGVPHGVAVAHGLLVMMVLSCMRFGFPSGELHRYAGWLRDNYGPLPEVTCKDYARLLELMMHDKKNDSVDTVNFTLLTAPGRPEIDCKTKGDEIFAALDIYRDLEC